MTKTKTNELLPFLFKGTIRIPEIKFSCDIKPSKNKLRYYCWIEDYSFNPEPFRKKKRDFKNLDLEIKEEETGIIVEEGEAFEFFNDDLGYIATIIVSDEINFDSQLDLNDPELSKEKIITEFKEKFREIFDLPILYERKHLSKNEVKSPEIFQDIKEYKS